MKLIFVLLYISNIYSCPDECWCPSATEVYCQHSEDDPKTESQNGNEIFTEKPSPQIVLLDISHGNNTDYSQLCLQLLSNAITNGITDIRSVGVVFMICFSAIVRYLIQYPMSEETQLRLRAILRTLFHLICRAISKLATRVGIMEEQSDVPSTNERVTEPVPVQIEPPHPQVTDLFQRVYNKISFIIVAATICLSHTTRITTTTCDY